jgi:hypothetical protein
MNAIEKKQKLGDRRKLKRFSDRLKISFDFNGMKYRGLSGNFSLNGIFIRTNHSFPPDTLLDIKIYLPNDLTSHLKGKVVRTLNETLWAASGDTRGYAEKGMGIEIIEKDALYLHFIRSFLSLEGRQLAFNEQGGKYQKIEAELQKKCHLFDVVAVVVGEESKQAGFKGKAWFEAKIKNKTDYVFTQPIVIFMTTKDNEHAQKGKDNMPPEIGTMLMSSSDNISHWKPGETIFLDGEIDPSSGDVPMYELNFFDYLTKIPEFAVDLPMNINDHVSTLWIGSPCIDEIDENIPDNGLFELLQPSVSIDKIESGIDDSAKSDDIESKDVLLLPSPEDVDMFFRLCVKKQSCHSQCTFFDSDQQHDEREETWKKLIEIGIVSGEMSSKIWDLARRDLSGIDLDTADLSGDNLQGAKLIGAKLTEANLFGADLCDADLSAADLRWANLSGAKLIGADLTGANLFGANLVGANLCNVNLNGATLSKTDLRESSMIAANLTSAILNGACIENANLSGWIIKDIVCTYIIEKTTTYRLIQFAPSEFEKRYTS